jgi:hypothetical protein
MYEDPVSKFQIAVNSANNSIRPYLLGINALNVEANLYDKIGMAKPWGSEDLQSGIPPVELQLRLQALSAIVSYANALAAITAGKDVQDLQNAAASLGNNVQALNKSFNTLTGVRASSPSTSPVGQTAAKLDLSGPLTALVTSFGTVFIQAKQLHATQTAILDGEKPINDLIALLKTDLQSLTLVQNADYDAMQVGILNIYNGARTNAKGQDLLNLLNQLVQQINSIQTLRSLQVDSLLTDMQSSYAALANFAKSNKSPKDMSQLSAQMNIFTADAALFENAVASVQSATKQSK